MRIDFSYNKVKFRIKEARKTKAWLLSILDKLNFSRGRIEFNFVSKTRILRINKDFLHHSYITDIITFSYSKEREEILAEVFICPYQVKKNAHLYGELFNKEIRRVLVHGILHCAGYHDLTRAEQRAMREAEDLYLNNY